MLTKCVHCGFNIRQTEDYCPNCGLKEPLTKLQRYDVTIRTAITLTTLFITVITVTFLSGSKVSIDCLLPFIILAYFISIIPIYKYFLKIQNQEIAERFSELGFTQKQILIDNRIADLNQRLMKIDSVIFQINRKVSKRLESIQQQMVSAQEIINSQLNRYKLQKKKIDLVRLQNELLPYLEGVSVLKDDEVGSVVAKTEKVKDELEKIEKKKDLSKTNPESFQDEIQLFLQQLNNTFDSCEKLHEVLLSRQAYFALQSVKPIEDMNFPVQLSEASQTIETFNIQTTLTDFSKSFEQLENEYRRLLADKEVSEKLLNYEN